MKGGIKNENKQFIRTAPRSGTSVDGLIAKESELYQNSLKYQYTIIDYDDNAL
jgi:hypothetical protein